MLDELKMEEIARDLSTKSEKIRALFRAGVAKADIGRFLGISYQHVYNVLARSKLVAAHNDQAEPDRDRRRGVCLSRLSLGPENVLNLPPAIVGGLALAVGDDVFVRVDGNQAVLMNRRAAVGWVEAEIAKGGSQADELVSELLLRL
ncbi:hypothetical protein [Phenylobacterium sp.]|uniref:hypothetical protein n=1 Tax=Phenylobacterium sp. TaxID=1871053 RepID=UPI0025EDC7D5|nr:hypothetical protein [Phenylobacterium sp.]